MGAEADRKRGHRHRYHEWPSQSRPRPRPIVTTAMDKARKQATVQLSHRRRRLFHSSTHSRSDTFDLTSQSFISCSVLALGGHKFFPYSHVSVIPLGSPMYLDSLSSVDSIFDRLARFLGADFACAVPVYTATDTH